MRTLAPAAALVALLFSSMTTNAAEATAVAEEPVVKRPHVPGKLLVKLRSRAGGNQDGRGATASERDETWDVSRTAIIICDMWNNHYCKSAAERVDEMAPRMNRMLTAARSHGVAIIHAPSGTVNFYAETAHRRRMIEARLAKPPIPLMPWCYLDPAREPAMPVDVSVQSCDDPIIGPAVKVFDRQHAGIKIGGYDGISDNGQEIFNFLTEEGIENVVIMGVHTNMCVLGRPFGIRQLTRLGFNVALARDMTDAMYDPRQPPYVSHTRGTELVIEHIERFWCPSLASDDLMRVLPGTNDPDPEILRRVLTPTAAK